MPSICDVHYSAQSFAVGHYTSLTGRERQKHSGRRGAREPDRDVAPVDFERDPSSYVHWKLSFDGAVATLAMDVKEDGGLRPDYRLKLELVRSGVDIELADAVQRIRFEHPEVRTVVITSLKERVSCAGANIFMLRGASRLEGQFLQVHERDAARDGRREPPQRAEVSCGLERHLRGWRIRARAGVRRDRPGR